MSYEIQEDWQMQAPGWRDLQIHKCLCTMKSLIEQLPAPSVQPLIYRALISQTGSDAPTAVILENTLGEVPTFSYNSTGIYQLNTVGNLFTTNKVYLQFRNKISVGGDFGTSTAIWADYQVFSDTMITIFSTRGDGSTPIDNGLTNFELTILIYP